MTYESDETRALRQELARVSARLGECEALHAEGTQLRESFLLHASHALRTPLTVVKGYAQLIDLLKRRDAEDAVESILPPLLTQVERLEQVVNDFLRASQLHHGRAAFHPERADLRDLLGLAVVAARHTRYLSPQHELIVDAGQSLVGWFDRKQVENALRQLAYNALQYSPQGGKVELRAQEEGGRAVVSVTDEGIGIPLDDQEQIFLPFARASNSALLGGAGLGLYIVAQVVALHGGDITVRSAPDAGSNFTLRLPLAEAVGSRQ